MGGGRPAPNRTRPVAIPNPKGWNELKAWKQCEVVSNRGLEQVITVTTKPQLSFFPQEEFPNDPTTLNNQDTCDYTLLSSHQDDYNG